MTLDTKIFDIASHLDNEDIIAEYLNEAIATSELPVLLEAIGHVARARGMSGIATETGLQRVGLYKSLSPDGNPQLSTFIDVIAAIGIGIEFVPVRTD